MTDNFQFTKVIGNSVYEIIPTENGYGYVVALSLCILIIGLYGHMNSFVMMYNDFLIDIGAGIGELTFLFGLNTLCVSFSGIFTNVSMKKYTLRQVGLFGASLYIFSWFLTCFSQNMTHLIIAFVISGVGTGILFSISFSSFNTYFVSNKRNVVMSVCQFIIGTYSIISPFIIKVLLENYGYRGMFLIYTGLILNILYCVISFHPLEYHGQMRLLYKTVPNVVDEKVTKVIENVKLSFYGEEEKNDKTSKKFGAIYELLDLSLLKDIVFINMMFGAIMALMTDITFFAVFPKYLYDVGLDQMEAASILSILGTSDLVSRAFLIVFNKFFKVKSEIIFYIGTLIITALRIAFCYFNSITAIYILTIASGFIRPLIQTMYILIYSEYAAEKFPAAIGWGMLFYGCSSLPVMSFTGFLYEKYGNSIPGFIFLTALNSFCIFPWAYKFWYFRKK